MCYVISRVALDHENQTILDDYGILSILVKLCKNVSIISPFKINITKYFKTGKLYIFNDFTLFVNYYFFVYPEEY